MYTVALYSPGSEYTMGYGCLGKGGVLGVLIK